MSQAVVDLYRCGHGETKCKASFSTREALQQHKQSVHPSVPKPPKYRCGVLNCPEVFEQHAQLVQHTNSEHRSKSTSSGTSTNASGLPDLRISPQQPLAAGPPSSPDPQSQKYPCPNCSKEYEQESYLIQHMNDKHRSQNTGLGTDNGAQTNSSGLIPRITPQPLTAGAPSPSASGPQSQKYVCRFPGCSKAYEQESQLIQHTNDKHRSKTTGSCSGNGTQMSSSGLDPRISPQPLTPGALSPSPSDPQSQKYVCRFPGCSKAYELESQLIQHANDKHRSKSTQTSSSGLDPCLPPQQLVTVSAPSSSDLQLRKYPCPGCSKEYEQESYLIQHMNDKHRSQNTGTSTTNGAQTSLSGLDSCALPQQPLAAGAPSSSSPRPQKYKCGVPTCSQVYESHAHLIQHTNDQHRSKTTGDVGQTSSSGLHIPPPTPSSPGPQNKARGSESSAEGLFVDLIDMVSAFAGLNLGSKDNSVTSPISKSTFSAGQDLHLHFNSNNARHN